MTSQLSRSIRGECLSDEYFETRANTLVKICGAEQARSQDLKSGGGGGGGAISITGGA